MHMNDDDEDVSHSRDSVDESAPLLPSSSARMPSAHSRETKSKASSSTSDHDLEAEAQPELLVAPGPIAEERRSGAERIEALYRVFGKGGLSIWALYGSLFLFFYAYSLAGNTVSNYLAFATSHFGEHTVLSTIDTMVYVIGAVGEPESLR